MTNIQVNRAKRQMLTLAMQVVGPSGSGKTLGSLIFAYGMMKEKYPDADDYDVWGKIGLVDTEHDRSLIYEGMEYNGVKIGQFLHVPLEAPYSIQRYDASVKALVEAGVEVCIIDSATHAWEGEGGVLDYQQKAGGRYQDWNSTNKEAYAPLVSLLVGEKYRVHMISTSRVKQEYTMQRNEHTEKMEVTKLGLKPVQRDTLEYEMQLVFRLDMDNYFEMSKDNSSLFKDKREILSTEHGALVYQWLEKGVDIFAERRAEEAAKLQERADRIAKMQESVEKYGFQEWSEEMIKHPAIGPLMTASEEMFIKYAKTLAFKIKEAEAQKAKEGGAAE